MNLFTKSYYYFLFFALVTMCVTACTTINESPSPNKEDTINTNDKEPKTTPNNEDAITSGEEPTEEIPLDFEPLEQHSIPTTPKQNSPTDENDPLAALKEYIVKLAVDSSFQLQEKGELRVWIGADVNSFIVEESMVEDQSTIPTNIGQYAKVTPYSPNFEVSPTETKCMKLDPSGSEVRFTLTPKEAGEFTVSANVELYSNADCSGPSVPKITRRLKVKVSIDSGYVVKSKVSELLAVVWDKFLSFWGALITFLLGALFFVIKRKVKDKTGYEETPKDA